MSEPNPTNPNPDPQALFQKGMELKKSGQYDAALTTIRRALIANPVHFEALIECGKLYREKAKGDPVYVRFAFESFQKALRLNMNHQEAHDLYILAGQQLGRLEDLYEEYKGWALADPMNDLYKRCQKNVLSLLMAQIPGKVSIGDADWYTKLRRILVLIAVIIGLMGIGLIGAAILGGKFNFIPKEAMAGIIRVGVYCLLGALGSFIARSFLR